mgnify:CR=1 FL=1
MRRARPLEDARYGVSRRGELVFQRMRGRTGGGFGGLAKAGDNFGENSGCTPPLKSEPSSARGRSGRIIA